MRSVLLYLFIPALGFAQESTVNYEQETAVPGKSFVSTVTEIGKTKDLSVAVITTSEKNSGKKSEAVRLLQSNTLLFTTYAYGVVMFDKSELDQVINTLQEFSEYVKQPRPASETSHYFITKNNFVFYCSNIAKAFSNWETGIYRRDPHTLLPVKDTQVGIRNKDIGELILVLKKIE